MWANPCRIDASNSSEGVNETVPFKLAWTEPLADSLTESVTDLENPTLACSISTPGEVATRWPARAEAMALPAPGESGLSAAWVVRVLKADESGAEVVVTTYVAGAFTVTEVTLTSSPSGVSLEIPQTRTSPFFNDFT